MNVTRIVLISFKTNTTESDKQKMHDALMDMKNHIPQILAIRGGMNQSARGGNFHYCLFVDFKNQADMLAYETHADHLKVIENFIQPIRQDSMMYFF